MPAKSPDTFPSARNANAAVSTPESGYAVLAVTDIDRSTINPRKRFDEAKLMELADSIRTHGLLEPIVVRRKSAIGGGAGGASYEIIAGERRWQACQRAGLATIPAVVRTVETDQEALELALIENLIREDIDPIEEAQAYHALKQMGHRVTAISEKIGRSQPSISNALRLLDLPADVQEFIQARRLSSSHGIALCSFKDYPAVCSFLAERAVRLGQTSKQMESVLDYQCLDELERKKLIVTLHHPYNCEEFYVLLPEGSFRKGQSGQRCCFDLLAYESAKVVWRETQERKMTEAREKLRQHNEATAENVAAPPQVLASQDTAVLNGLEAPEGEKFAKQSPAPLPDLPKLSTLAYGTFRNLELHKPPTGCSDDCACRSAAIEQFRDRDGRIVPICANPERFDKLKKASDRDVRKQRREKFDEKLGRARQCLDSITRANAANDATEYNVVGGRIRRDWDDAVPGEEYLRRAAVIACWCALKSAGKARFNTAAERLQLTLRWEGSDQYGKIPAVFDTLRTLPVHYLVQLTAEVALVQQVGNQVEYGSGNDFAVPDLDWLLSAKEAPDA